MSPPAIPYADQVASVEREIKLRDRVYPRRVAAGQMTQGLADQELARMRAVLETLKRVQALDEPLRRVDDLGAGLCVSVSLGGAPEEELEQLIEESLEALRFKPAEAGLLL